MTFDPCLLRSQVWLYPRITVFKSYGNTSMYVDTVINFEILDLTHTCKNFNQRSLTTTWCLTPSLLRSHVLLYPRIIVTKSHENTLKYVDRLWFFFFKNFNQRSLTPRWPLTHTCWGRMCNSTQGSFCPSPMWIHQCMWIQWSQNTIYYIHTTYYYMSDHIVSFWTQFRQDNKLNWRHILQNLALIFVWTLVLVKMGQFYALFLGVARLRTL